jgi:hypothetical protein
MTISRDGLRLLLLHEYRMGSNANEVAVRIDTTMGPGTVHRATAYRHRQQFFDSKPPEFYKCGIEKLPERWGMIIDSNGSYIV